MLTSWTTEAVLSPLGRLLEDVARLAILPLGRLAWLPLTTAGPAGRAALLADREPVLIIRATVGALPADPRGPADPAGRVVIWADTGPAGQHIPAVVREARQIESCYAGAEVRINKRSSSLAGERFRSRNGLGDAFSADLVHLAWHCGVDAERPQETVLHVEPPIRIGSVTATSRPGRSHIVLSACDAALTATSLPDEALSAATAFLLAGAGTVTAPLWPVCDAISPAFMRDYHSALVRGMEPARALASVQRRWAADRPRFLHGQWVVTAWPTALCDA